MWNSTRLSVIDERVHRNLSRRSDRSRCSSSSDEEEEESVVGHRAMKRGEFGSNPRLFGSGPRGSRRTLTGVFILLSSSACLEKTLITNSHVFISLKGWRRMEEKRVSSIMGWFRQRFGKQRNEANLSTCSPECSPGNSNPTSSCSACSSSSPSKSSSSAKPTASERPLPSELFSSFRSVRRYDVCLCHTEKDIDLAKSLASFLEEPCKGLRCYLQERDCPLGGAVSTELLQAVRDSHCWVLLITPDFLKDDWCSYQMHQVLSEGPMSQRIIPAVINMPRSELPQELRFVFSVDLNTNKELGYNQVYNAVLHYLKDMCEKEKPSDVSQSDS